MLNINVLTVLPNLFTEHLNNLPFKKALSKNLAQIKMWNLRDYALDSYGKIDDKPYGGGVGMLLMIEPIYKALTDILGKDFEKNKPDHGRIILLSPRGKKFTQKLAQELSKEEQLTFICGRYEGVDARIEEHLVTDVISIGDYVLTGGEVPALAVMESVVRLLPGVLEKEEAVQIESFSMENSESAEFPQYTRPEDFKGYKVPEVLLSGNHGEIEKWRKSK